MKLFFVSHLFLSHIYSQTSKRLRNLQVTTNENMLVINNDCDQTIININSFLIHTFAGTKYNINAVLSKMSSSYLELVSDAYILVTIDENKIYF